MSGTSEVLQEYLVKLGFKVDQGDYKKFTDTLGTVGKSVLGVGLAVAGVVAGVEAAAAAFAYSMRKVYFDSQLANSSVKNLQSLSYAGQQFGISAESMGSAIHSMAQQLRLNPGMRGVIESFGVKVEGRDVSDVMTDYVKALSSMPEFQASQFAGMFGMDPDTYHQFREHSSEIISKQQEMKELYKELGTDMDEAAKSGAHYASSLDNVKMHLTALENSVLTSVMPTFDKFTEKINTSLDAATKWVNVTVKKDGLGKAGFEAWANIPGNLLGKGLLWGRDNLLPKGDGTPTTAAQRSTGVLPIPGAASAGVGPTNNAAAIAALEKQAGLPPGMLWRVYGIESGFGKNAGTSSAGALGPFQFTEGTGKDFGLTTDADRMDFGKSSKAAARYLSRLMSKYGGNTDMALSAYNWGPKNVDTYGIANLNPETQGYLNKYHAMEGAAPIISNVFHITGNNASDIAGKVAGAQERVYADAMRNGQGAVR